MDFLRSAKIYFCLVIQTSTIDIQHSRCESKILWLLADFIQYFSLIHGKAHLLVNILIEKHICLPTPRPIWPLGGLLPISPLQFFVLINVVVVLFWISASKGQEEPFSRLALDLCSDESSLIQGLCTTLTILAQKWCCGTEHEHTEINVMWCFVSWPSKAKAKQRPQRQLRVSQSSLP